ncbi:TMEM175 family protein [Rhodoblastus sp.]|uniref:TMEM175 family protein n=1 Tax=Rhodoblastus sp. TaxID=1962975 RepID=UPI00261185A4|nr:TMEM175 family protein [Rhodoblastus sp.]
MSSFLAHRIEVLSDTIFGVAMTTPVYSLLSSRWNATPASFEVVLKSMFQPAVAFGCSFLFSGVFWVSHHRRLALTEARSRRFLFVSFAFLFLIVLLPAPTILWGQDGAEQWTVALYSGHLAAIACVNEGLWIFAILGARSRPWPLAIGPGILAVVFLVATVVSIDEPRLGPLLWLATVLAPIVDARVTGQNL